MEVFDILSVLEYLQKIQKQNKECKVRALYNSGYTCLEIAAILEIPESVVRGWVGEDA